MCNYKSFCNFTRPVYSVLFYMDKYVKNKEDENIFLEVLLKSRKWKFNEKDFHYTFLNEIRKENFR